MRDINPDTESRLTRQGASICTCWRITQSDGTVIGLTDHDQDVVFGGTAFSSALGADGTATESSVALSADNAEVIGVLAPGSIDPSSIDQGKLDNAQVEIFLVDWEDPTHRFLIRIGTIGQVERDDLGYRAEFRSVKHALDRPSGRVYGRRCDVDLGSAKCGVNLEDAAYRYDGVVAEAGARRLVLDLGSAPTDWFTHGLIVIQSGALTGLSRAVFSHRSIAEQAIIEVWQAFPATIDIGTAVTAFAGCDKSIETCQEKFSNGLNFRGFPHIPGNDALISYPISGASS